MADLKRRCGRSRATGILRIANADPAPSPRRGGCGQIQIDHDARAGWHQPGVGGVARADHLHPAGEPVTVGARQHEVPVAKHLDPVDRIGRQEKLVR